MKMKKILSLFFCAVLTANSLSAQKKQIRKADALFNQLAYAKAIPIYILSLKKDSSRTTMTKIANSYFLNNDYINAKKWYLSSFEDEQNINKNGGNYAQVLINLKQYEQLKNFKKNYNFENEESFNNIESLKILNKTVSKYIVEPVSFNSERSEFASFIFNNKLYVSQEVASKNEKNNYPWTNKGYFDIYTAKTPAFAQFGSLEPIKGNINTALHEGASSINKANSTLYFTRNNSVQNRTRKNKDGFVNLKLYSVPFSDGSWKKIKAFDYNNDNYSVGHPTITPSGKYLFFVSDIEGGFGGTDIYVCEKKDETWGEPVNLGPNINTPFNEMFPTAYSDNELIFSSKGHNSFGGLDIFSATKRNSNWQNVQNIGSGINSSSDDFSLIYLNDERKNGYFSSNRPNGSGGDDVYSFKLNIIEEEKFISKIEESIEQNLIVNQKNNLIPYKVSVYDEETGLAIEGVNVDLFLMPDNTKLESTITNKNGEAIFMVNPNKNYSAQINKGGYFKRNEDIIDTNEEAIVGLYQNELNKSIEIKNIYYKLDKWDILPESATELDKIVKILNDNKNVNIELSSHTDSRGSAQYNEKLSAKRAQSATAYITSKGINSFRIKAVGYGEKYISNRCFDNIQCSEDEHLQNRRTEFKVIGYGNSNIISKQDTSIKNQEIKTTSLAKQSTNGLDVFYSIQIGAYSKSSLKKIQYFNNYGPIYEWKEDNVFVYTVGQFNKLESAQYVLTALKKTSDAKDAYIVKIQNNKRINLKK